MAGAGAGKTKTIVERVLEIIRNRVNPNNILCVTFTNKAASEMRERITQRLVEEKVIDNFDLHREDYRFFKGESDLPMVKTFHSLGLYLLKREHASLGLVKNFTILDTDDTRSLIKEYLESAGYDTKVYDPSKIRSSISREKGDFKTVQNYRSKIMNYSMEVVANSWDYYNRKLREMGAVDFDDLIVRCVELLRDNQEVREKYQNLFKYIHVDEYQDTNNSQYELIQLLVDKKHNNICVVGDTDQNIYSWRGANLKNIMSFEKDYKNAKVILLEQNYRSTQNILSLANNAIKKNTVRKDKKLFTNLGEGEKIEVFPAFDGDSEAELIARKCKELIEEGVNPSEIAILYRTNFQSRVLEEKMINENVPYNVLGIRFFDRKEIKDVLSYLRVALNRSSQVDLKRVLEFPKRGIGKASIAKLFAGEEISGKGGAAIVETFVLLDRIKSMCQSENQEENAQYELSEILTYILTESRMEQAFLDDGEDGAMRLANISELITLSENYTKEIYGSFDNVLEKFLEVTSLSSDQDDDKKEKVGVRLMTVHASKGLEFEHVFISGLEEDLFPSKNFSGKQRSKEEEEEERRLFYVAVTRARKKLYLSYAEMRTIFGQRNIALPSQFLSDLVDDIYNWNEIYYKQNNSGKVVYI
ncbi:MAG: ATP-dependent helicase UvrD/PcrA [Patescibacteria group bacterium]|nr:ATP-dependent helicase UvrD/PcrA [Patescibacteria group bacterium]